MASLVKICGLQSADMLVSALESPVDYIGLVFAESKRKVSPAQAAGMLEAVKQKGLRLPEFAGVFVNPSEDELRRVLTIVPLDIVQLHGAETPEYCRWVKETFRVKVFKVFPITQISNIDGIEAKLDGYAGLIDALMLDTYDPQYGGGSGKTFRWEMIPSFRAWTQQQGIPLLIAGGLHEGNVKELLEQYAPDGVDVSSGVETNGMKDIDKIHAFVGRVKQS
jgi:phosphoribosylanthranilate isomerase